MLQLLVLNAHRVSYSYDNLHRTTEEISYELNGKVKGRSTYKYDDKGNVIEEHRKDDFSTIDYLHHYEYDTHRSWVKQTIQNHTSRAPLFNDKPDESDRTITKPRKITYF